jgi:hypothetical protein
MNDVIKINLAIEEIRVDIGQLEHDIAWLMTDFCKKHNVNNVRLHGENIGLFTDALNKNALYYEVKISVTL